MASWQQVSINHQTEVLTILTPSTGIATGGWVTIDGSKYYFDTKTFKMVTGSKDRSMV